jgi:uncharacterized alpha-E superfamily protein
MLCRVAEDVFWMSRYVERVLAVGRLIDVTEQLELGGETDALAPVSLWAPVLAPRASDGPLPPALRDVSDGPGGGRAVRRWLAFDPDNPRSLVSCVRRGRDAARRVRESISSEVWEALNSLHLSLADPALPDAAEGDPHGFYQRIRQAAQFVQGLADATLAHDEVWHFMSLGKYLERADNVAHVLALQAHLLRDDGRDEHDLVRWLAVLRSCGAAEGYARYYALRVEPARVVEFLLLNAQFPQTVRLSLRHASDALAALRDGHRDLPTLAERDGATPATRALGLLTAQLEHAAVDEIMEGGLQPYLAGVQRDIARVCDHLTRVYLRDEPQLGRVMAVARAAMLMAEQQQQSRRSAQHSRAWGRR